MSKKYPWLKFLPLMALWSLCGCALFGGAGGRNDSPPPPASQKAYANVTYSMLSDPLKSRQYNGKFIQFKAMFLGKYDAPLAYKGMYPDRKLFINHRDASYVAEKGPLGGSDLSVPPFPLTAGDGLADFVRSLKSGDLVDVKGYATMGGEVLAGRTDIYVDIYEMSHSK